jgi:cell division protease FtsH
VGKAFGGATDIPWLARIDLDEGARVLLAQNALTAHQFPAKKN